MAEILRLPASFKAYVMTNTLFSVYINLALRCAEL